jgi:NADPH-dependent glutamate synthase beta subunit-like oxidoreductase/CO/xanthine dehydrogenase FAD-binding subunit
MKEFKHVNASSVEEATSILKEYKGKARVIAGGTDLVGQMKDNILPGYPEVIVNVKTIAGLDYIKDEGQSLKIGALTRLEDIAIHKAVKEKYAILAEAARRTASPHIRDMGTMGGNICQSNRCWYYWVPENRFYCMRKGGRVCYAMTGDGRNNSIFGSVKVNNTPCSTDCPTGVDIPLYMSKIREGDIDGAAAILLDSNPFPAITGRVCPHFCESECNRRNLEQAVSIRGVERFIGDYILEKSRQIFIAPQRETGKRIAIVGSGPTGLSTAYYLRKSGHKMTVFESMEKAGGMLMYGIPPYRLPKDIIEQQVDSLERIGIQFKLKTQAGISPKVEQLMKDFDAVFFACGAWKEKLSGIKGEELLVSGTEFLRNLNLGIREVPGRKIAVIGGGNVAVDVARSLLRLGTEPTIIYRRTRAEMPAINEEVDRLEQEGITIQFLTLPDEVSRKDDKLVLTCIKMELGPPDETGRPRPVPIDGSKFSMEFDSVIKAIGEDPDTSLIPGEFLDGERRLKTDDSGRYLGKNVFVGGDFVTGPSTVVESISAGRQTAYAIDRYLGGKGKQDEEAKQESTALPQKFSSSHLIKTKRTESRELPVTERIKSADVEDVSTLGSGDAEAEANRCFNCGCVAVNSSDIAPALIALDAKIKTSLRVIEAEKFFTVEGDKTTVLADDEVVTEIEVPLPAAGTRSIFTKFALRKSIDFPIVNCAAAIASDGGTVKEARICLNAVYNIPYRAKKSEQYITGKPINDSTAEEAANAITTDTCPLSDNKYKVQIAKTLIKRAILACNL